MRTLVAGLFLIGLLTPAVAQADRLGTARAMPLKETRHAAELTIEDGVAHYRVERRFDNAGKRADEVRLDLGLPVGGAAVGLRIKVGNQWLDGELMRRERAAELYQELTGFGPHQPKDPALLSWTWASELELRVFPVPAQGQSNVGYSLVAPTTYRDGRYFMTYPRVTAGNRLTTSAVQITGADGPMIDGKPVAAGELHPLILESNKPAWMGEREPVHGASYVRSDIAIPDDEKVDKATIAVDIQHTYRGDLTLELVTPDGQWRTLVSSQGGGDNDIRESFDVTFDKPMSTKGNWRLVVSDRAGLDTGTLKKWSVKLPLSPAVEASSKNPVFIPDAKRGGDRGQATISVKAPPIHTLAARLGSVPASPKQEFFRLEIDAAAELRPMPKNLHVVFVVDASRSLPDDAGLEPQLDVARAFVSHVPDAKVDVVLVRRRPTRLTPATLAAPKLAEALDAAEAQGQLELGNGSNLDEGLELAGKILRGRKGPGTVVLLTDNLLRPSWHNRFAFNAMKKVGDATVHVVLPSMGSRVTRDQRDDDHALSPIAKRGGGILLHVRHINGPSKQLHDIALGLVRPIRIDDFRIEGAVLPDTVQVPSRLEEGTGIREMTALAKAPKRLKLRGKIWARPFERDVVATLPFSKATAAFVFSHDMHGDLNDGEMFRLAMTAGAVSPVTSYLAIEPGVRPSTEGLTGRGQGFGSGHGRLGRSHRARAPRIVMHIPPFDFQKELATAITKCEATHKPAKGWTEQLRLHLTLEEIVDIERPKSALGRCLAEATWDLALPIRNFDRRRQALTVTLQSNP